MIPRSEQKLVKSIVVKLLPLLHLILFGMPCLAKTSSNNLIVVAVSILSELLTTTKCEKQSSIKRYLWAFHSKLSMLSACHGLLVARSLIKGLAQFFAAYFIEAGHADIISLISLVKPGQKTDCLAQYGVLLTPI